MIWFAACLLTAGCAQTEVAAPLEDTPSTAAAVDVPVASEFAPAAKAGESAAAPETTVASSEKGVEAAEKGNAVAQSSLDDYKAPYPDRVELFVAPKRQGGARTPGESQDAVELLGFVKVDRPKVVLSINGQVSPVAEGDEQFGVEVISIQPPVVVLQRGRQRWSASLEN